MRRAAVCGATLALAAVTLVLAQSPRVGRPALRAMEQSFDKRILTASSDAPFDLLGTTRGVYLEGYGSVFTTELNLLITTNLSPFQLTIPKEYVTRVHAQKVRRLPLLKRSMQEAMLAAASSLDNVRPQEKIVFGVSIFYYKWEDTSGLPGQIVMHAERQKLLDVQVGRTPRAALVSTIRVQEL